VFIVLLFENEYIATFASLSLCYIQVGISPFYLFHLWYRLITLIWANIFKHWWFNNFKINCLLWYYNHFRSFITHIVIISVFCCSNCGWKLLITYCITSIGLDQKQIIYYKNETFYTSRNSKIDLECVFYSKIPWW